MALKAGGRDRIGKVTGSLMYYIAGKASEAETNAAFMRCVGELPPIEETYAMRLGSHVEPFMVREYENAIGVLIERRQDEVPLAALPDDVFATIDGMVMHTRCVTEFKFCSPHFDKRDIFNRYYDQVALQMMCTNAVGGLLIVGQGTNELIEIECLRDEEYEAELLTRIHAWLLCVKTLTPPFATPMPKPPPERWRTIDLDIEPRPNWGYELLDWLAVYDETMTAASNYDAAGKAARNLVPDDVGLVLAHDYRIARNKRGVLSIGRRK